MALPTTNLTASYYVKGTTYIFTTYNSNGVHTGVPADGGTVQVWDEAGGVTNQMTAFINSANVPIYRSATPLMKQPCLDWDGTDDVYKSYTQTADAIKATSNYVANNAKTLAVAFYPEAITNTSSSVNQNEHVICDWGSYFGITLRDVSGAKKCRAWNFDSNYDVTSDLACATDRTWIAIITHDGTDLVLTLIDDTGAETSATVASGNTGALTNPLGLAAQTAPVGLFNGRMGEFAIYNAVLTGQDMTDLKDYFKSEWMTIAGSASVRLRRLPLLGAN